MQPHGPTEPGKRPGPLPIAQVDTGMTVTDSDGEDVGKVTAVQQPGTDVHPDLPAGLAERLMASGYVRIDGTGLLAHDTYAAGDHVAAVTEGADPGVVTLTVPREELFRSES